VHYNQYLQAAPPPHTLGHIIDWDPNLSYIDQNLVCELKISMSPTRQGQGLAAPATLAVNGHGFTMKFL
jgi:hypothetical protein